MIFHLRSGNIDVSMGSNEYCCGMANLSIGRVLTRNEGHTTEDIYRDLYALLTKGFISRQAVTELGQEILNMDPNDILRHPCLRGGSLLLTGVNGENKTKSFAEVNGLKPVNIFLNPKSGNKVYTYIINTHGTVRDR